MDELKRTITDLFSFDFDSETGMDDESKEMMTSAFRQILDGDEETVKPFIQKWFADSMETAKEFDLVVDELDDAEGSEDEEGGEVEDEAGSDVGDAVEEPTDEANIVSDEEDETVESVAPVAPIAPSLTTEQYNIKRANRYLI